MHGHLWIAGGQRLNISGVCEDGHGLAWRGVRRTPCPPKHPSKGVSALETAPLDVQSVSERDECGFAEAFSECRMDVDGRGNVLECRAHLQRQSEAC